MNNRWKCVGCKLAHPSEPMFFLRSFQAPLSRKSWPLHKHKHTETHNMYDRSSFLWGLPETEAAVVKLGQLLPVWATFKVSCHGCMFTFVIAPPLEVALRSQFTTSKTAYKPASNL